jgi:predicted dehydrogenase
MNREDMQKTAKKYRVAVLGLGHWYSAYGLAKALRGSAKAEVVAAAWHDAAQLEDFTRTFGAKGYRDCGELLAKERVDIVLIASPVSEIKELTVQSARAGKHMILGKPMAMTVAEAEEMVAAVDKAGVLCFPFQCHMRLQYQELKARLDRGEIGDILLMHQTSRWSIAEDWMNSGTPGWFADPKHVPGGALIDEGIYWVDFFRWITGSEVVEVEARVANLLHKALGVEDWGLATFTLQNGVICTLEGAWTIVSPRKTAPSPKGNAVVRIEIVGNRGEMADQFFRVPGRSVLAAGAQDWVFERHTDTGPSSFDHLVACLESGQQTIGTIHDAYRSFVPCMAAYDAARQGKPAKLL